MPWLIKGGIDTALHWTGGARSLVKYPLLILGAAALQGFFRYCWRINIHGFSRRCEADLRDRVFTICKSCRSIISSTLKSAI